MYVTFKIADRKYTFSWEEFEKFILRKAFGDPVEILTVA